MSTFRFADMFRFAGGAEPESESAKILQELHAEALAYGIWLELDVWPGEIPSSRETSSPQNLPIGKPFPKRAREIVDELLSKHYLRLCDAVNAERRARGQKQIGDGDALRKRQADFERAYYGKFRHSEKARWVVDLLRAWHGNRIVEEHLPVKRTDRELAVLFKPLLNAAESLDVQFLNLLAQAAQMLDIQIRSSKDRTTGTRGTYLDLCLLQYGVRIAGTKTHTPHEINEQLVSKFRTMSDKKVHDRLHELDIPHKDEPRGPASPNYGFTKGWAELKARAYQRIAKFPLLTTEGGKVWTDQARLS